MLTKQILNDTDELLEKLETDFILLNEKSISYIQQYDAYAQKTIYDGSLLKDRMKTAVVQAVPNDI